MADQTVQAVQDYYNKLNTEGDVEDACRLNDKDLTADQQALFNRLSEGIKVRYYGTGLNIPENVEGKRIIDLGCGSGSLVFILSKLVGPSGYVVGVDITEGLIETAKAESAFHAKQWGYDKPNFEFHVGNLERLDELGFQPNSFDIVVSNGVFCLIINKELAFKNAFNLLKEGGQFYINDVNADRAVPEELHNVGMLWAEGITGGQTWEQEVEMMQKTGFTSPYMTCAAPVNIISDHYNKMLEYRRFACVGRRLFKLPPGAKREASRVTYNGNISAHPEVFPWDVDLTFKKGEGVDVNAELATILSSSYLSDCFSFDKATGSPSTKRTQDPFAYMDRLKAKGKTVAPIYDVE